MISISKESEFHSLDLFHGIQDLKQFIHNHHAVKSVRIQTFLGLYFSTFGYIPAYSISRGIQFKCWKTPTKKKLRIWTSFQAVHVARTELGLYRISRPEMSYKKDVLEKMTF